MSAKFTAGPWKVEGVRDNHFRVIAAESPNVRGHGQVVCEVNGPWKHENYKANARLIAAAPDLMAALEDAEFLLRKAGSNPREAVAMSDSMKRSAGDARAAIEKAKGGGL